MKPQTSWRFAMLATVPFIMVLGNSMLIPVLPKMQSVMHLSKFQVGLLITIFSIPAGLIIPWAGMLSDRVGRKTIIVPALVVYGVGGLIAGASALLLGEKAYWPMMAGRLIQGVGAGGTYQLAMALTGDIFKTAERTKALGLLEASNGMGKVVSPIAGAAAALIIWFAPFFIYGLLAIPIAAGVWYVVKEPQKDNQGQSVSKYFDGVKQVFASKGVPLTVAFLAGSSALYVLFGMLSWYSDILEDRYHIKGFLKGFVIAGPVLASAISSYLTGAVMQKKISVALPLAKGIILGGSGMITVGLLFSAFFKGAVPLFVAMVLIGIGNGLTLALLNTLVTSSADTEKRGAVTALYGTVRFFGVALGPPAFGLIDQLGQALWLLGMAALMAGVGALIIFFLDPKTLVPGGIGGQPVQKKAERYQPGPPAEPEGKNPLT